MLRFSSSVKLVGLSELGSNAVKPSVRSPSTSSRDAGDRKQTADLTATQLARNHALIGDLRGKVVSVPDSE